MSEPTQNTSRCVFSIGHSNHPLATFLNLLAGHEIEVVVDTRSYPFSKAAPQFNGPDLKTALRGAGRKYLFLGRELGGRPEGAEFYDDDGHVLYDRVAASSAFQEGIRRLENGVERFRVALLCSEEDPVGCHRRLLVGRVLASRGVLVEHIRGNGCLVSETKFLEEEARLRTQAQIALFATPQESPWRSIRSVLHRSRPRSSSLP